VTDNRVTEEQFHQALLIQAAYDRQKQEELAARTQLHFERLKPLIESEAFAAVHQHLVDAAAGLEAGTQFSVHSDALITIMPNLVNVIATWHPIVPPTPMTVPEATAPAAENTNNG
jgi:hypothetical protein